ncbi:hypothetical protein [Alishewanella longhuensis]|nr:hypothetical protein [Alishewanella longhuensis]
MKQYFFIGLLIAIVVIFVIKYAVTERAIEPRPKYENVREYIHQMVFANGIRSRALNWEVLPIPIYLDLHSADIRSKIENTMRTIEHNVGVPLFLETNDYRQAQIFLVTSRTGQERLPDFLTRFLLEVLGSKWLELFQNKAPVMFDAAAYPQAPDHPCFTQEFFSDPSTQYDGGNRKPTQMQIFIGGVAEIENDILNECLIEELLHAAFFLRDADLTHGKHSIFNQSAHADRARLPTQFDLCLISELLNGSFEATALDKMASSIHRKLTNGECPVWRN